MKTILFIEDEAALQKTLGETLRSEGFQVISALDGEQGLRMAEEEKPDLILLDLVLPKMNGFEVLKRLKQEKETKGIPVIVLTNLEQAKDVDKVIELGGTTYLIKSDYSLEDLTTKIKQIIK